MTVLGRRGFLRATVAAAPLLATGAQPAALADQEPHGTRVWCGADVLAADGWARLRGRRVGVLTNPTAVLHHETAARPPLTHLVDAMVADGVRPVAVFGPEHGFRGTAQAGGSQGDYTDPRTGLPVYDAYGASADALAGMFRKSGVDTVLFDIADVGARPYTYVWTMYTAMEAAARTGAAFVVLDRPNPLGGLADGPQLDPAFASAVGRKPITLRHGLTVGELAALFDAEFLPADAGRRLSTLDVVALRNWRRDMVFADTGLAWVPPSPNLPTAHGALVYPGLVFFEGTLLSEGRGTTRPFETVGGPHLDWRWAEALNAAGLPGVVFRETYFVPTFSKHANETCGGAQLEVTDPRRFDSIRAAVTMLVTARKLAPAEAAWRPDQWIDKLSGSDRLRRQVDAGAGVDEIVGAWQQELAAFRLRRARYLRYT